MMEIINAYKKQLIVIGSIVVVAVIAALVFLTYQDANTLRVTSSNPMQSSTVSYETPIITLSFNKPLSKDNISISIPNGVTSSWFVEGQNLYINIFSGLAANSTYKFTINSLSSTDGKSLSGYNFSFNTDLNSVLSKEHEQIILERQQANKPSLLNDPILAHLPHNTDEYNIKTYLDSTADGKGSVTIEVTSYLSREDINSNRSAAIERIKKSADAYLESLEGIELSKYPIIYKVQEP